MVFRPGAPARIKRLCRSHFTPDSELCHPRYAGCLGRAHPCPRCADVALREFVEPGRSVMSKSRRPRMWLCRFSAAVLVLLTTACADDATGPGFLYVRPVGAAADTVWHGAPGEPIPSGVAVRIKDSEGQPLAGASVTWEPVGRNALVLAGSSVSDAHGLVTAVWQLGTDATEQQELHITVRWGRRNAFLTLRARAVPHIVAQLRVSVDSPAVLRLGDSLP